jgi:hypothetical protein
MEEIFSSIKIKDVWDKAMGVIPGMELLDERYPGGRAIVSQRITNRTEE